MCILASQTGGADFDFGNSPREFTTDRVQGRTIITTTTNGTRALQSCVGAKQVFVGSFLNMNALIAAMKSTPLSNVVIVGAGTFEEAAYEDTLAAGMLCDALWDRFAESQIVDSARIARAIFRRHHSDILGGIACARNGRRLLEKPELRDDVAFCARLNTCQFTAELRDGAVRISSVAAL